jgi:hypothetical protein
MPCLLTPPTWWSRCRWPLSMRCCRRSGGHPDWRCVPHSGLSAFPSACQAAVIAMRSLMSRFRRPFRCFGAPALPSQTGCVYSIDDRTLLLSSLTLPEDKADFALCTIFLAVVLSLHQDLTSSVFSGTLTFNKDSTCILCFRLAQSWPSRIVMMATDMAFVL